MTAGQTRYVSTARLEAFSDGVFSIAATLLVLNLNVPGGSQGLGAALLGQWPSYATYVVSFGTIGIIWVNHHSLSAQVRYVDRVLLFLNLLLLMVVSVIPFPTSVLAHYVSTDGDSHVAAALYGGVMVVMSLAFSLLWLHITRGPLLHEHMDSQRARQEGRLFSVGLAAYVAGIALAVVSAQLSLLLYALTAVFYVFPWLPEAAPARTEPSPGQAE